MAKEAKSVSNDFRLVGIAPGELLYAGKEIDTRTMDYTTAAKMADDPKCPYVVRVEKAESK